MTCTLQADSDQDYDSKACRILAVDDEAPNLKLLNMILRGEGYKQIELIQDPRLVVERYQALRPDLILLDINMPHVDGYGVMTRLAALNDKPAVPILILTAQSGEDFLLRALEGGASDFLTKPFNRKELLARVNNQLLAHLARRMLHDRHGVMQQMIQSRTVELNKSRLDVVQRLARASEFRDNETGQHVLRMSHASALLAARAGWTEEACELMLNASPLHDVGKIGIPDRILLKPGRLTDDEMAIMREHTTIGAEILSGADNEMMRMAGTIALCHHERWDGGGYPNGLSGLDIPEAARIVAIADVFDALTSARPYKEAWPVSEAIAFINSNAGGHFDPGLVVRFGEIIPDVMRLRERFAEPHPCASASILA